MTRRYSRELGEFEFTGLHKATDLIDELCYCAYYRGNISYFDILHHVAYMRGRGFEYLADRKFDMP